MTRNSDRDSRRADQGQRRNISDMGGRAFHGGKRNDDDDEEFGEDEYEDDDRGLSSHASHDDDDAYDYEDDYDYHSDGRFNEDDDEHYSSGGNRRGARPSGSPISYFLNELQRRANANDRPDRQRPTAREGQQPAYRRNAAYYRDINKDRNSNRPGQRTDATNRTERAYPIYDYYDDYHGGRQSQRSNDINSSSNGQEIRNTRSVYSSDTDRHNTGTRSNAASRGNSQRRAFGSVNREERDRTGGRYDRTTRPSNRNRRS